MLLILTWFLKQNKKINMLLLFVENIIPTEGEQFELQLFGVFFEVRDQII